MNRQKKIRQRPGPHSINEISVRDTKDLPHRDSIEVPLHPKRRRVRQSPPEAMPAADRPPLTDREVLDQPAPPVPPQTPPFSVPSPAMFVECDGSGVSTPSTSDMRHHSLSSRRNPVNINDIFNYGSDISDEELDEEEMMPWLVPRTYASLLDTPMDDVIQIPVASADASTSVIEVDPMATDQPRSFADFQWEEFPSVPIQVEFRRERFSDINVGPTTPCADPYDIFTSIWDKQIMEHIASETNRYAQQLADQMLRSNNLHPTSRISRWQDTTADELYTYFAIVLAMGVVVKSQLKEYWSSTSDIFSTPGFRACMSFNRFVLLTRCLHFNNNEDMCSLELDVSEARLFKITPILKHLNTKFQTMYNLEQNISLDESLLMWKGWLNINQLVPNKAATVGIKTYEVCESQTGYLWRFEIHSHKRSPPQQSEDLLNASTPAIVLRLLNGLEHKGHTVWMDNFYNSPLLARRLKTLGFDCALRTNRMFVPEALNNLTKGNICSDQLVGLTSGDVDVMVWHDSNTVAMISTYHGNAVSHVQGSTKPILIYDYNIMMGGVDKKDQMLAMYPIERKRTKVWYKKLFKRLLNVSVLNSYIIHRKSSPTSALAHRLFRTSLINSILSKHCPLPAPSLPSSCPSSSAATYSSPPATTQNVDITHRLELFPIRTGERLRRQCVICRKRVQTFCFGCRKTVCNFACFTALHTRHT